MGEVDGFLQALLGCAFAADDVADFYVGVAAGVLFGAGSLEFYTVGLYGGAAFGEDLNHVEENCTMKALRMEG